MLSVALSLCLLFAAVCGQTKLSGADKQELLEAHNHFRSKVNPIATNMEMMVWNNELATVAQTYAEQCVFEHNTDRVSQQNTFTSVGENILLSQENPVNNYTGLVGEWQNQGADYDYPMNTCSVSAVCGAYTQVVWANSNNVGCGVYRCNNSTIGLLLVCNYGPAGNFIGQSPFMTGNQSCSACPPNSTYCESNLCTASPPTPTMDPTTTMVTVSMESTTTDSSAIITAGPSIVVVMAALYATLKLVM
ncbi:uncharacterized protein LOC135345091 [Halichondria panicea]|uniref:uncharacterized protein LOC135345091 n=1 Tax=Halichondria panicea TaxID=6063 RepID=UPI00312B710E